MIETPHTEQGFEDATVLSILLDAHPGLVSLDELVREVGSEAQVKDAHHRLYGAGLIHTLGEFAFASRAAARFHSLNL